MALNAVMRDAHFLPQRIYPKYATLLKHSSRIPRVLPLALKAFSLLIQEGQSSSTESFNAGQAPHVAVAIVGFPRTGTTFLQYGINSCLTSAHTCWKGHDVFDVPRMTGPHTVRLVTLREPFETSISWSIYNDDQIEAHRFRLRLDTYTAWHRKLLRIVKGSPVRMVHFDEFTRSLDSTCAHLLVNGVPLEKSCVPAAQQIRYQLAQDQIADDVPVIFRNTPSESRLGRRAEYEELMSNRPVRRSMKEAQSIYEALSARSQLSR